MSGCWPTGSHGDGYGMTQDQEYSGEILDLTEKQQFLLKSSWTVVTEHMKTVSVKIFTEMLRNEDESVQDMFPTSPAAFRYQCYTMFRYVDDFIQNVDNYKMASGPLYIAGSRHKKVPGFKAEYFQRFEEPFLQGIQEQLAERFTPQIEEIYGVFIKFLIKCLEKGFREEFSMTLNKTVDLEFLEAAQLHASIQAFKMKEVLLQFNQQSTTTELNHQENLRLVAKSYEGSREAAFYSRIPNSQETVCDETTAELAGNEERSQRDALPCAELNRDSSTDPELTSDMEMMLMKTHLQDS